MMVIVVVVVVYSKSRRRRVSFGLPENVGAEGRAGQDSFIIRGAVREWETNEEKAFCGIQKACQKIRDQQQQEAYSDIHR